AGRQRRLDWRWIGELVRRLERVDVPVEAEPYCLQPELVEKALRLAQQQRQVAFATAKLGREQPHLAVGFRPPRPARPQPGSERVAVRERRNLEQHDVRLKLEIVHRPSVAAGLGTSADAFASIRIADYGTSPRATATASSRDVAPTAWSR